MPEGRERDRLASWHVWLLFGDVNDPRHIAAVEWLAREQLRRKAEDAAHAHVAAQVRALARQPTHAELECRRGEVRRPRGVPDVDRPPEAAA